MATYTKLQSGDWGLRGTPSELTAGAVVTVRKSNGETKRETVGRVVWTGNGVSIATIVSKASSSSSTSSYGGRRGGYRGGYANDGTVRCRHCGQRTAEGDDWCMACGRADYEN